MTKLKKTHCDKTKKENRTKLNSNYDKTQKLKLQYNLKSQIVTKLKNPNCENFLKNNCNTDKTRKNQAVIKLKKKLNCGKTQVLKL